MEKPTTVGKSIGSAKERGWDDEDDSDDDLEEVVRPRPETHPDNADRLVPPSQVRKKPGSVFTRGEITLHTNMGHRMFYGRRAVQENGEKKPMIIGLVRFITNINSICDLAKTGDPYADHYLIKLEQALIDAREDISDTKQFLLDMLVTGSSTSRVSIKSGISESPVTLPLVFKHKQYGFQGAELVGLYDEVVQLGLNAKDAAWLSPNEFKQVVSGAARKVRNCFWISYQYKYSGALREDFISNNQRAQSAVKRMGFELPEDILMGRRRPLWMPHSAFTPKKESETVPKKTAAPAVITETEAVVYKPTNHFLKRWAEYCPDKDWKHELNYSSRPSRRTKEAIKKQCPKNADKMIPSGSKFYLINLQRTMIFVCSTDRAVITVFPYEEGERKERFFGALQVM